MSILNSKQLNLVEAQQRSGFTDKATLLADFVKINDFLNVVPWTSSNHGITHKTLKLTSAGKGGWGKVNSAITTTTSKTTPEEINVKLYDGLSKVDERIFDGCDDPTAVRMVEDIGNLEGITDDWLHNTLYSEDTDLGFPGLFTRRNSLQPNLCWDGGATGNNKLTSLLLCELGGPKGLSMLYESGTPAGISSEDRGRHYTDGYFAWLTYFKIMSNILIPRETAVQRLANLDPTATTFPLNKFVQMKNQLPSIGAGTAVAFVNRSVHAQIENECLNKTNMAYTRSDIEGYGPVTRILGIPVMTMEAIIDTESKIA